MSREARSRRPSRSGEQRGSATVEFALLLPFLLVVFLALVQIGLVARDQLSLEAAVRDGAREAAAGADDGAVRALVERVGLAELSVTIVRASDLGGPVSVAATGVSPLDVPTVSWLLHDVTVRADATMRQETGDPV